VKLFEGYWLQTRYFAISSLCRIFLQSLSTGQVIEIIRAGANGVIAGSVFVDIIAGGIDVSQRSEALARGLKEGCKTISKIDLEPVRKVMCQ
jgi:hypothetical protein